MYQFQSRIRYSEIGENEELTLESLLDYFQDCSIFHSEDIGLGLSYLSEIHQAWMLSAWQICVNRYPRLCEEIIIGTAPYDFKGFLGFRNFEMKTTDGEVLAYANSIWTLMDAERMLPAKPDQNMLDGYVLGEKYDMEYAPRKISLPANAMPAESFLVRPHHLDTNHHVNNGQYVRMAMDFIPKDFFVTQLRAEYKEQAVLDDCVYPLVAKNKDATIYTVSLNNENERPYCIVELTGKES